MGIRVLRVTKHVLTLRVEKLIYVRATSGFPFLQSSLDSQTSFLKTSTHCPILTKHLQSSQHKYQSSFNLKMSSSKKSSSRKWDSLDTLVYMAGGRPHVKARSYVQDKAWDKTYGEGTSYLNTDDLTDSAGTCSSYWSTSSTDGSSSSNNTDTTTNDTKKS